MQITMQILFLNRTGLHASKTEVSATDDLLSRRASLRRVAELLRRRAEVAQGHPGGVS